MFFHKFYLFCLDVTALFFEHANRTRFDWIISIIYLMKLKQLNEQLGILKITYEDAILKKASQDELKKILVKIDELNKIIAVYAGDRLH